ncbi:hypothetical protein EVAR_59248_1 [Eumeta japonica]|uniref:Uncharacterized protein n=1 Tax=Eumeta variegata TaxID=151549 RepID=A0A4C2A4Y0_EUMVA|nr:hypothetical protein EVAR_59248_1 [Eumeta japonica]
MMAALLRLGRYNLISNHSVPRYNVTPAHLTLGLILYIGRDGTDLPEYPTKLKATVNTCLSKKVSDTSAAPLMTCHLVQRPRRSVVPHRRRSIRTAALTASRPIR